MNLEALKNEIDKQNIPIADLAEKCGMDRTTIYRIINGQSGCSIESAKKLIAGLKLSKKTASLIFFDDDRA
jgi:plasmid maintenance system antidote protein VapI